MKDGVEGSEGRKATEHGVEFGRVSALLDIEEDNVLDGLCRSGG